MEKAMGSRTSVHVGCLAQEYSHVSQRDTNLPGSYQIVGSNGLSMLANRLSWFYDFTGPSMAVDTVLEWPTGCTSCMPGFTLWIG
jgi:acyl transferase domain-containing protein